VLSGLTDWDADFRRLAGYLGPNIKALDKALLLARLLELRAQKVSQGETPSGGRQPSEKYLRKLAKELQLSKDQLFRSQKIASISPPVQQKIRELGLDDNQAALLKIAEVGDNPDLQLIKAKELHAPLNKGRPATLSSASTPVADMINEGGHPKAVSDESASVLPDIPLSLRRNRQEIDYERLKHKWSRVRGLFLSADPAVRERFITECLKPMLSQAAGL
jgi:transcriptional regulator with XRE-family HTH domain